MRQVDRARAVRIVAQEFWETAMQRRAQVDGALSQVGKRVRRPDGRSYITLGRVTADLVREGREWVLAGEWEDVPKHFIRRPIVTARHEASDAHFISGNCDELAEMAGMSEDDFRDALRSMGRKPKVTDFLEAAEAWYNRRTMSQAPTTAAERKAAQRARARADGRCVICCREKVAPGNSTCHSCGARANASKRAKKAA